MSVARDPYVLGISASHNGSACVVHGNRIVVAVQEERLTRRKRARVHAGQRSLCVKYCLDAAGIRPDQLDLVVVSVQGYSDQTSEDAWLNPDLRLGRHGRRVAYVGHHLAHAHSVYCTSPFADAAILVVDGGGSPVADLGVAERAVARGVDPHHFETVSMYRAEDGVIEPLEKYFSPGDAMYVETGEGMPRFASLGSMFEAVSKQLFGDAMQAGKVMGLAPYGRATSPASDFFSYVEGRGFAFSDAIPRRFTTGGRWPDRGDEYADLAASTQAALETAMLALGRRLESLYRCPRLCLSGGVALNGIVNELLLARSAFREQYVYPAAEDSGVAVGAACYGVWLLTGTMPRVPTDVDRHGATYDARAHETAVAAWPGVEPQDCDDVVESAVRLLVDGKVVGLFQGESELGPRALGNRSILFDPRRPDGQAYINAKVKGREGFRPLAPACLEEEAAKWFVGAGDLVSPFMLRVVRVKPAARDLIPAVTHVDGTSRLQTVTPKNGMLHAILRRFFRETGVPMLLNTSFNVAEEPLVETPDDALLCMLCTNIDACVLGDRLVIKSPDFESLLAETPEVIAASLTVRAASPQNLAAGRVFGVTATAASRWGRWEALVDGRRLAVLRAIDGRKTGWHVLRALRASAPQTSEREVHADLAALARVGLIRFKVDARPRAIAHEPAADVAIARAGL
jgi:carbamoyltransferase